MTVKLLGSAEFAQVREVAMRRESRGRTTRIASMTAGPIFGRETRVAALRLRGRVYGNLWAMG
ncbi:MAG: hypothetical protein WCA22_04215 [Candidatus Binatus sp.]